MAPEDSWRWGLRPVCGAGRRMDSCLWGIQKAGQAERLQAVAAHGQAGMGRLRRRLPELRASGRVSSVTALAGSFIMLGLVAGKEQLRLDGMR